ncbi:hypothetical protein BDW62DRAFT_201022 [Aspergillus aurantiobrunneus]
MKLSLPTIIIPLFVAVGMAAPVQLNNPVARQLQGSNLLEALANSGGITGALKNVKLPLSGGGGPKQ